MAISQINTDRKRERLAPRGEPYWEQLAKNKHLGYRKGKKADSWTAKYGRKSSGIGDSSIFNGLRDREWGFQLELSD